MLNLHKIIRITQTILNSDENLNFDDISQKCSDFSMYSCVLKKKKLRIFLCKSVPIFILAQAINHVIPTNRELSRVQWPLSYWKQQEGCFCLCSLLAVNKLLVSFFYLPLFPSAVPGHPWSWSCLITKQIQCSALAFRCCHYFPSGWVQWPWQSCIIPLILWLLSWFLWLWPSAIHINNINNNRKRKLG